MLFSKAVNENIPIRQLDIPTAFLNGKLKTEVYINPPQGLKCKKKALRLQRALYGLDESPKCWNETIDIFAKRNGFKRSEYDYCLYYKNDCWMLIYVDDILIIGNSEELIKEIKNDFKAKDLGEVRKFLGMDIERENDKLILKQTSLIEKILKKFDMTECNGVKTPMETNFNITTENSEGEQAEKERYRELIGSLSYLAVTSRPDLTYTVSYLSRYLEKSNKETWKAAKRILRYIKETKDRGLIFKKTKDNDLNGYSDADWANNKQDRKSISGGIVLHGQNPIAWFSKKQNCVALSTAEAEYIAAAIMAQELVNLKGISEHLNCGGKVNLLVDNQGAISMTKSFENSKRTKHIDIKYHFIKDLINTNKICIKYVCSTKNLADVFTKALCHQKFENIVTNFMI